MNGAFYVGATGLDAQRRALDVIANNIANINTVGFKRSSVRFSELVTPIRNEADEPINVTDRAAVVSGVAVSGTTHVWTQGSLRQTGQALDLAIDGAGFVELVGAAGRPLLWRGGSLKVNADGYLVAADGTPLRAMISVPLGATALTIARDGTVAALIDGQADPEQLGQIDMVMVKDPDTLVDVGGGYYQAEDPAGTYAIDAAADGNASFVQGALESANVQLTDEMTNLLVVQRAFAANAQIVQAGDQLMAIVNGLRR
jgi:flagellar basal-body rod protein FlgG